ncbi:MAG: hypothetical protein KF865_01630 [Bdellovibrionaceae bacterium]|nr:hypothetical protein [Pseudobdellovibrionaceae bacterium]
MKKAIVTFLMLLCVSFVACSQKSNGQSPPAGTGSSSPTPGHLPDNVSENFDYNKLMYSEQGTCGAKGGVYFKYLLIEDSVVGKSERGNDLLAEVRIALSPDRKFVAHYEEKEVENYTATGYAHKRDKSRIISGYWFLDEQTMVVGDLLRVKARMVDNRAKVSAIFLRDVITPNLRGMAVSGGMVWSTSPGTKSYREVCPTMESQLGSFAGFASQNDPESIKMSSLQLVQGQQFQSGSFYISDMQLFLHKGGSFHLLLSGVDMNDPTRTLKHYIVEESYWDRTATNKLNFYIGALLKKANGGAKLCLTRDLYYVTPLNEVIDFPIEEGKCVDLEFRASNYSLDDLTGNYR